MQLKNKIHKRLWISKIIIRDQQSEDYQNMWGFLLLFFLCVGIFWKGRGLNLGNCLSYAPPPKNKPCIYIKYSGSDHKVLNFGKDTVSLHYYAL